MRRLLRLFLGASALALGATVTLAVSKPAEPRTSSVVRIALASGGHGSGVHIAPGLVLTAAHVVSDSEAPRVVQQDGVSAEAKVLWTHTAHDVALLYVPNLRASTSPVHCGELAIGERIHAVGNPTILTFVTTFGRIAGETRDVAIWRDVTVADLTVGPGMSGGPVFNERNEVVGLVLGAMTAWNAPIGVSVLASPRAICRLLGR